MAVEFMDFFLPLPDSAFAIKPKIERSLIFVMFRCQNLATHELINEKEAPTKAHC